MIIHSISIKNNVLVNKIDKTFQFNSVNNLIYSKKNSVGKTTLLRFILYSLGFNVPNTKKIKLTEYNVIVTIELDDKTIIKLNRKNNSLIYLSYDSQTKTFALPAEINELHSFIFKTQNVNILNNILGTFYFDQEKGWTLLNRGDVIGSNHFNIEKLVIGLSGKNCDDLFKQELLLSKKISSYRQMFNLAQYKETLETTQNIMPTETYNDTVINEIQILKLNKQQAQTELTRISQNIKNNRLLKDYINSLNLSIEDENGKTIVVTSENIIGMNDSIDLLIEKQKFISSKLSKIKNKIEKLEKEFLLTNATNNNAQLFNIPTLSEDFDNKISAMPLDQITIKKILDKTIQDKKITHNKIIEQIKNNNNVVDSLIKTINLYADELEINKNDKYANSYLFTSNLKELSGALLHKTVFAFKLAYIKEVEKLLKIKLPIILDSPTGKEITQANVETMCKILARDFPNNQIIIASIWDFYFKNNDNYNILTIKNKLLE